jgi:hypothetical protein
VGWLRLMLVLVQRFLDSPGAEGSDALVDRESVLQTVLAFAVGAILEVGAADSFQGACFLQRCVTRTGCRSVIVMTAFGDSWPSGHPI